MAGQYPLEALLRPAVELYHHRVLHRGRALHRRAVDVRPHSAVRHRGRTGLRLAGYRAAEAGRRGAPLPAEHPPTAEVHDDQCRNAGQQRTLFIGKGFRWTQKHTQRLADTYLPQFASYVEPSPLYSARAGWRSSSSSPLPLKLVAKATAWDVAWNPARPLPPVGGLPRLHGIEPREQDVGLQLGERVGHTLVLGTTRVGKTRLAELFITQDIRRTHGADASE